MKKLSLGAFLLIVVPIGLYGIIPISRKGFILDRESLQASCPKEQVLVGKKAPNFTQKAVVNGEIIDFTLYDSKADFKALLFYPADFTMVCPTELHAMQDAMDELNKRKVQVIAISTDSAYSHKKWLETPKDEAGISGVTYPLVADFNKEVSYDYGVLDDSGVALRGLYIIDKDNIVQYMSVNNLSFGRSVPEMLRIIDAITFTQEHGSEVCPMNWQKGHDTMEASPEGAKKYFQKQN